MNDEEESTMQGSRGYEGFGGVIGELTSRSTPWWRPERRARDGAPNVIVVLVDDMGFSDLEPFGGEIDTPAASRLAEDGYRLSNYHTTPLCSPSRAALLTGLNPHRAGFGTVAHADPGYPGYRLELADDVPTLAESFHAAGYATFMAGKWHLTKETRQHDAADRSSWPLQRGFDHYFGALDGMTTLFHPHRLIVDNTALAVDGFSDDFYLTDELTSWSLERLRLLRANDQQKPFFLYLAHHAVHGPLQARPQDIERYRGRYDSGWDHIRDARFRRQIASGLFPDATEPSATDPASIPPWDTLPTAKKELFARHMEVYAAAVDAVDRSLGDLVAHLEQTGEYDNTIIVVTSDNGATGEGGPEGTRSYLSQFVDVEGLPDTWVRDVPRDIDLIGSPQVFGHYPTGWGHVSNTPFRFYKGSAYAGGVHAPLLLSWPAGLPRAEGDEGVRSQYAYVTDIAPTLLALAGVDRLAERRGVPVTEPDGASFAPFLRDAEEPTAHRSQYVECGGERGFFADGLKLVAPHQWGEPFTDDGWELYDIDSDPAETRNLAAEHPDTVRDLAARWREAAWANTVFPLDDANTLFTVRPSTELPLSEPVVLRPGPGALERYRSGKLTSMRSFVLEIALDYDGESEGVLFAHGDQGGGYAVTIEGSSLWLAYNAFGVMHRASAPLAAGTQAIRVAFTARPGLVGTFGAHVDGEEICRIDDVPVFVPMAPFTGISVGVDYGSPVDWDRHVRRGSFRYDGTLHGVRVVPGPQVPENPEFIIDITRRAESILE